MIFAKIIKATPTQWVGNGCLAVDLVGFGSDFRCEIGGWEIDENDFLCSKYAD